MSGRTGKRARPAGLCFRCGQVIQPGLFERSREGDSHIMNAAGTYPCSPAFVDHDYHAHTNEHDRALWNSLKPVTRCAACGMTRGEFERHSGGLIVIHDVTTVCCMTWDAAVDVWNKACDEADAQ